MNEQVIAHAKQRAENIAYAAARIQTKIDNLPNDSRQEAWKNRLEEYKASLKILGFTIETGRYLTLKGEDGRKGVVVNVPAGKLNLESN